MTRPDSDLLTSIAALEEHYPAARPASRRKEKASLTPAMQAWLKHSPFFILSSIADNGIDGSPRGDRPGEAFHILDARRIAIPDRRGNNRIDTLRNIVADDRVGLVFVVPGVEETLRLRGRATISIEPSLLAQVSLDGEQPTSVILVTVQAVWVQNYRAVRRARLWQHDAQTDPDDLPDALALAQGD